MTQGQIEKAKLTASFLNSLASGTILAAIVAPYVGWALEQSVQTPTYGTSSGCPLLDL
jgi:hypothetical protein